MKKIITTLILILNYISYSQTPVNAYVIHQGCPYGITDTWSSQCGAGNMILDSVDYLGFGFSGQTDPSFPLDTDPLY